MFDAFVDASNRLALADEQDKCVHQPPPPRCPPPIQTPSFIHTYIQPPPTPPPHRYFPGFARKEHDAEKGESWSIWETDAEDYNARSLGNAAGWFALVGGNTHQAMWMATREQVRVRLFAGCGRVN